MTEEKNNPVSLEEQLAAVRQKTEHHGMTAGHFLKIVDLEIQIAEQSDVSHAEAVTQTADKMQEDLLDKEQRIGYTSTNTPRFVYLNKQRLEAEKPLSWEQAHAQAMEEEAYRLDNHEYNDKNPSMRTVSTLLRTHAAILRIGDHDSAPVRDFTRDGERVTLVFDVVTAGTDLLQSDERSKEQAHIDSLRVAGAVLFAPIRNDTARGVQPSRELETSQIYLANMAEMFDADINKP